LASRQRRLERATSFSSSTTRESVNRNRLTIHNEPIGEAQFVVATVAISSRRKNTANAPWWMVHFDWQDPHPSRVVNRFTVPITLFSVRPERT